MRVIKSTILAATLCSLAGLFAHAQPARKVAKQTAPDALVAELYKQSDKSWGPFFQTRSRALVNKYFDKPLADLIWKDAVTSRGEVGALGADPLYNAQDTEIKNFVIHKPTVIDKSAEVRVSFENFHEKQEIVFVLTTARAGWKISNIKYNDGTDILGMLKAAAEGGR